MKIKSVAVIQTRTEIKYIQQTGHKNVFWLLTLLHQNQKYQLFARKISYLIQLSTSNKLKCNKEQKKL